MSLWQFSESSQPLLKRCIEASTFDENNKWVKRFGHLLHKKNSENVSNENGIEVINLSSPNIIQTDSQATAIIDKLETQTDSQATMIIDKLEISDEFWQEIVDSDIISRFDFIVENCLDNSNLYIVFAKQLPLISVEKLCEHVFETESINSDFLENFYKTFLPVFLKREHSRSSIDIIIKSEKCNKALFKYFLEIFITDIELPSQVFQQFISTLDNESQIELMNNIIFFDLSNEVFIHHLYSIQMLYKNYEKTEDIQKYILLKLSNVSQQCVNDKNYGRLLLNYLQSQKKFSTNFIILQKIIDVHRSPFKKPCMNAFNELKKS